MISNTTKNPTVAFRRFTVPKTRANAYKTSIIICCGCANPDADQRIVLRSETGRHLRNTQPKCQDCGRHSSIVMVAMNAGETVCIYCSRRCASLGLMSQDG